RAVAAGKHVLPPVVDAAAVDPHVAEPPGGAAFEAGSGEARALGHEAHDDRSLRLALDQHVLSEAAAKTTLPARPGTEPLVVEEERALSLRDLHRRRRDVARPREHALAVLARRGAHAAVQEEHRGVGLAVVADARLG